MTKITVLYGIKNCDTVKKARQWLEAHNIDYQFHDYRVDGIEKAWLQQLMKSIDWTTLLNTRGTTWRKLDPELRATITDAEQAQTLMLANPTLIKRPLLAHGEQWLCGFSPTEYQHVINGN